MPPELQTSSLCIPHPCKWGIESLCNGQGTVGTVTWDRAIGDKDVDELLHGFEVTICEQAVQLADADKEAEAAVQVGAAGLVDVPEGVDEVGVVEVGVDAEHLAPGGAHITQEALGEAGCFAEPVTAG